MVCSMVKLNISKSSNTIFFVLMMPWLHIGYYVQHMQVTDYANTLTDMNNWWNLADLILRYCIYTIVILQSRILFYMGTIAILLQRLFETFLYILFGKFLTDNVAIIREYIFLFTPSQIIAYLQTHLSLTLKAVLIFTVCIVIYGILSRHIYGHIKVKQKNWSRRKIIIIELLFLLLISTMVSNRFRTDRAFWFEPYENKEYVQFVPVVEKAPHISKHTYDYTIDFYYIRGESLTPSHMSLYGYERNTTPYLDSIKSDIAIYHNVYSPEFNSAQSDVLMFSRGYASGDTDFFTKPHLIEELMHSNIPVMYIGYNDDFGAYQNNVYQPLMGASEKSYFLKRKHYSMYDIDDIDLINLLKKNANPYPTFYFVHTVGSHTYFGIDPVFSKQRNIITTKQQDINIYDDTVLKTDRFLKHIHMMAEQRKQKTGRTYVIWYMSDHSLLLYRDGSNWSSYNLDKTSLIGRDIPFLIWNEQNLPCAERLPEKHSKHPLNATQTFYWVLGALCLYNGDELNINPPLLQN